MRISLSFLTALAFLVIGIAAPSSPAQVGGGPTTTAAPLGPFVVELQASPEMYALGDVHGDYDRLCQLLAGAHVIAAVPARPEAVQWSAGQADLVCTGDVIDRYDQSLKVIALLRALEPQARKAGGHLVVTLGNREAEFLASSGKEKKEAKFDRELAAAGLSPADVAAGRDKAGVGAWMRQLPVAAKVGDWFFCHAGNTGGLSLADLAAEARKEITAQGYACPLLADPNSLVEARMHPRPWWEADANGARLKDVPKKDLKARPKEPAAGEARLRATVNALGCKHLVFGHQPGEVRFADGSIREAGQVYTKFNGLVFLIDTGMSRGVADGKGALLKIHTGADRTSASAVYADGTSAALWP